MGTPPPIKRMCKSVGNSPGIQLNKEVTGTESQSGFIELKDNLYSADVNKESVLSSYQPQWCKCSTAVNGGVCGADCTNRRNRVECDPTLCAYTEVQCGGNPKRLKKMAEMEAAKKKKLADQKEEEEIKALFKAVSTQKVEKGADPKTVFCQFFKQGLCKKGDKCKFSHDPDIERKAAKKNLYEDTDKDEIEDMTEEQLAEMIAKKHSSEVTNATAIVCKNFVEAVENNKYGWFWECPNGGKNCKYKHALPPGFVLKKDKKKADDAESTITIEDLIEKERAALSSNNLTKVTLQTFVAWKKKKLKEKALAEKQEEQKRRNDMRSGKMGGLSGRDMFIFDPKMIGDAEEDDEGEEFDLSKMDKEDGEEDDGVRVHEIKFDEFGIMDDGMDDSTATTLAAAKEQDGAAASVDIDEDLFDDEDLDDLDDDLDAMAI